MEVELEQLWNTSFLLAFIFLVAIIYEVLRDKRLPPHLFGWPNEFVDKPFLDEMLDCDVKNKEE